MPCLSYHYVTQFFFLVPPRPSHVRQPSLGRLWCRLLHCQVQFRRRAWPAAATGYEIEFVDTVHHNPSDTVCYAGRPRLHLPAVVASRRPTISRRYVTYYRNRQSEITVAVDIRLLIHFYLFPRLPTLVIDIFISIYAVFTKKLTL